MLIAVMVVKSHVDGRLSMDGTRLPVMAASANSIIR
jgi:hypothetical protein